VENLIFGMQVEYTEFDHVEVMRYLTESPSIISLIGMARNFGLIIENKNNKERMFVK